MGEGAIKMTNVAAFLKTHGRPVFTANVSDSLADTAEKFGEKTAGRKYSLAVVCDSDDRPVGVIGLGDIVFALAKHRSGASDLPVRNIMTSSIISAGPGDDIRDLLRVMAERDVISP